MSADPWDDWETAADAGLIDCKEAPPTKKLNQDIWEKANAYATPKIIQTNDSGRSEYKPELKILKRPEDARNTRNRSTSNQNTFKGLAEREKDYEEAKRKINEKFNIKK